MSESLIPYACLLGHVVYSDVDLSRCFCPLCLGAAKDKEYDSPTMLSVVQGKTEKGL